MTNSQNGWPINPTVTTPLVVAGVTFGPCRAGDVFTVLEYVATRYHNEVEHLIKGTCGCYNPRKIPDTDVWSNHASMTAIDCNWQRHPLGARGTYSDAQRSAIGRILAACGGVVRWGGVYTTTVDEMHFEINKDAAAVKALAVKIRNEDSMALTDADADVILNRLAVRLKSQGRLAAPTDELVLQMRSIPWTYQGGGLQGASSTLDALADGQAVATKLDAVIEAIKNAGVTLSDAQVTAIGDAVGSATNQALQSVVGKLERAGSALTQ